MITVYVWDDVPVVRAVVRVPLDRLRLRRQPFGQLVGTARGFDIRSADPHRWLAVVDAEESFERSPLVRVWDALAGQRARLSSSPTPS